jgi:bifunctional oligoribonuclease and PAP phosphatase NrnA
MAYYPDSTVHWERIRGFIEKAQRLFISTHVNPDGDALGSVMALAGFLANTGRKCRVLIESDIPEAYRFLDPGGRIESYPNGAPTDGGPREGDLVIFLDLGRYDRVGNLQDYLTKNSARRVIIDHHRPEQVEADVAAVNPLAESAGSLLFDLLLYLDRTKIDSGIATALLTAIVTDTGYFRYSNTSATTHAVASSLYEYGARVIDIRKRLESGQTFNRQKLLGLALSNLRKSSGGRIVYAFITSGMFEEADARREHTEGIIDQIRIVRGCKVAALIIEDGIEKFKVSFRTTERVSANDIAAILGGGGHARASGALVIGSLDEVIALMIGASETVLESGD